MLSRLRAGAGWDVILVDARRTTRVELEVLMGHGLVVCLDEGGKAGEYASFLIDALPGLPGMRGANVCSPAYLSLPRRIRASLRTPVKNVLISFGGEDRENLSGAFLDAVLRERLFPPGQMAVVEGPLFENREWPAGLTVIRGATNLARILPDYDLLITHFGITAFEALATGIPVILLNPSRYHARLAAAAGLPDIGTRVPHMSALRGLLADPQRLYVPVDSFNALIGKDRSQRLPRLLRGLTARGSPSCPLCRRSGNRVIARFSDRTYRRCAGCGFISMESFAGQRKKYGAGYFSSEYKAQYGRTYLEDFDSIKAASRSRVQIISSLLGNARDGVVVDVGCAYGPFLDALKDAGMPGYGVDVAQGAVAYVRKKLRIPALKAAFESVDRTSLPRRIVAVTLWYVLEHFPDTDVVIRKAAALLPPGGVFAFSTPNGRGISARRNPSAFLFNSPADHFTILSPQKLRKLLAGYDLELKRIRVTGHHPERFPGIFGRAASRRQGAYRFLSMASRLFQLGDTFEAYAVKGE
jgi:2-polyprenyl-3-methyl-5-hydroxy-6-metoxy-1,4-benzoquinol methylase